MICYVAGHPKNVETPMIDAVVKTVECMLGRKMERKRTLCSGIWNMIVNHGPSNLYKHVMECL